MAAQPRIVRKGEWGAATGLVGGRGVAPSQRRFFVVHWPVMGNRDERQWCRDIERIHRNQWALGPGYNFLVGQSGTIYEGCGRDVRGIHSPPRNTDGWGVCCLQPSTANGSPTAAISQPMRNSTRALYEWLCTVAGRRLTMSWHGRDFATACPGGDLRAWVQGGMQATGGAAPAPAPSPGSRPFPGRLLRQPPILRGDDVRAWQQQINARGFWGINVDGAYGPESERVCREFQRSFSLPASRRGKSGRALQADGIVGPETWAATFS